MLVKLPVRGGAEVWVREETIIRVEPSSSGGALVTFEDGSHIETPMPVGDLIEYLGGRAGGRES